MESETENESESAEKGARGFGFDDRLGAVLAEEEPAVLRPAAHRVARQLVARGARERRPTRVLSLRHVQRRRGIGRRGHCRAQLTLETGEAKAKLLADEQTILALHLLRAPEHLYF